MHLSRQKSATKRFGRVAMLVAVWIVVALALRPAGPAQAQSTDAQHTAQSENDQITRWIEELGNDSFAIRRAAAENLLNAGPAALEPLSAVAAGPDPELRASAKRIVSLIEVADFRRRLEAFANDVDGKAGLTLPGWETFRERVGDDAKARALFVDMQRHEATLLAAMFSERPRPAPRDTAWEERLMQLVQWQYTAGGAVSPPLASCAAMLLVGIAPKNEVSDRAAVMLAQLVNRPPLQESLQTGTHREALRRLVTAWVLNCKNNSDLSLRSRIALAEGNQMKEAVTLAISVAAADPEYRQASSDTRMQSLLFVGRAGSREHVARLERILDDTTVCYPAALINQARGGQGNVDLQMRDVALVVLLRLTDQSPADYEFRGIPARSEQSFSPVQITPTSIEHRNQALAKWRKWRAANPDAKLGSASGDKNSQPESK